MANISKISAQVAANSAQFDTTIDKVQKKLAKLGSNSKNIATKTSSAVSDTMGKVQDSLHNVTPKGGISDLFSKKNLKGAGAELGQLKTGIMSVKGAIGLLAAAAAAVGVFMAAKFIYSVVESTLQTQLLAKQLGMTTTSLLAFQFAAKGAGVDVDIANQAMSDLVGMIAKVNNGDIAAIDIFRRLGLSVSQLSKMTPTQAFGAVADSIMKFGTSAQKAALLTQLFGDKAALIAPLIAKGSEGLDAAADKAKQFGLNISDVRLDQMRAGKAAVDQMLESLNGLALIVAAQIGPTVIAMVENISRGVSEAQGMVTGFQSLNGAIKYGYFIAVTFVEAVRAIAIVLKLMGLQSGVMVGWLIIKWLQWMKVIVQVGRAFMWLFGQSAGAKGMIKDLEKSIAKMERTVGRIKDARESAADDLDSLVESSADNNFKQFDKEVERIKKAGEKSSEAAKDLDKTMNEAFKNQQNGLAQRGLEITKESASPLEKYRSKMMELNNLLKNGAITWQTYSRAVGAAVNELEQANNASNISLPSLARGNTSEAVSAVNKARNENQFKNNETPQQRLERIQSTALQVQQRQEKYQAEMAQALQDQKVYEITGD